jgi:hypothetical protein
MQTKPRTQQSTLIPAGKTNEEKLQSIKEILRKADTFPPYQVDAFIWRIVRDWKLVIEPDVEAFNLMLQFFSSKGNRTAVRQIFDLLLAKRIQPNTESFNHILAAYSASGSELSTSMIHSILSEMKRLNVPFSDDTYVAAFELFCRIGAEETVNEFLSVIRSKNINTPAVFSHLLTMRLKQQRTDDIIPLFEESITRDAPLSIEDWRRALKFLLPRTEQFKELWRIGLEKLKLTPDSFSFGLKQDSLLEGKDGRGAFEVLSEMTAAGIEPNSGHYGRAIMGLPIEEAQAFVQKIREEKPELVDGKFLSGLIYNLEYNKQFDKIEELFNSIPTIYHYKIDDTLTASYLTCMMHYDTFVGLATYLQLRQNKTKVSTSVAADLMNQLIQLGKLDVEKLPKEVRDELTHDKLSRTFLPTLDKIAKLLLTKKLEKASKSS